MNKNTPQNNLFGNVPEFSVSELAHSVKRTVEDTFGRVRVRGELSNVSIPKSGHIYTALKDDKSKIDAICWKGNASKLSVRPEEGLEVICTGKMTTYPSRSNYQLIIETMELAGEGALLKMLEERKKKLAGEGLFAPERKKKLPFLPQRIGVITSPTGAVIRDILHRLQDRFPRHVLVWPVKVQGEGADNEITRAIDGFNALPASERPDLLIVARGGGSLEDLMPFNSENVVRATANSLIPIISAVGHETDTTLIDHAADLRAPTPTGAAEMAVPVRLNLIAQLDDNAKRLTHGMGRALSEKRHHLDALSAKLGTPERLLELKIQHIDRASDRLDHALQKYISQKKTTFTERALRLTHPKQLVEKKDVQFKNLIQNLNAAFKNGLTHKQQRIANITVKKPQYDRKQESLLRHAQELEKSYKRVHEAKVQNLKQIGEKLDLLSFENVLKRGYVVVRDQNGVPITQAVDLNVGQDIALQFAQDQNVPATISEKPSQTDAPKQKATTTKPPPKTKIDQGSLF